MCQTNDVEKGRRPSDIRPKRRSDLKPSEKGTYMEEALTKTGFGLYNYALIVLGGLILFVVYVETIGISFVLPVTECDLGLTAARKGLISGATLLGTISSAFFWGYLTDVKGRRAIMMPTLLAVFITSCASSLAPNFYIFFALRFLNGFFVSGSAGIVYVYLGEFHSNKYMTSAIISSAMIFTLIAGGLPIVAYYIINQEWQIVIPYIVTYKPWRSFIVLCSLPSFISFVILLFLPESPKFVLGQGKKAQTYEILQKMHRWNNGKDSEFELFEIVEEPEVIATRKQRIASCKESSFPLLKSIWIQTSPLFKSPHIRSTFTIFTIQFTINATAGGMALFVPEIINRMASNLNNFVDQRMPMCSVLNMKQISLANSTEIEHHDVDQVCVTKIDMAVIQQTIIMNIAFVILMYCVRHLVTKIGKFPVLITILVVCGSGGYVSMLTDIPLVQVCSMSILLFSSLASVIIRAATIELYPTAMRGMAICLVGMLGRLGSASGGNITALLLEYHCEAVFYLFASSILAIAVLSNFIPNIRTKIENPEIQREVARHSVISLNSSQL